MPPVATAPLRLVKDDEIQRYERALIMRLEANKHRTCLRPPLRGAPVPGTASAVMLALDRPAGALATCLADLAKLSEAEGGLMMLVEERRTTLRELDRACGAELQAIVEHSVTHGDACSPYLGGIRVGPAELTRPLQVAHLVGLRARLASDRDPVAALWLALDLVRFGQDLGRSTSVTNATLGLVVTEIAIESARWIVARRKLSRADLDTFSGAVAALQASEPPVASTLAAELDHFLLHVAMAPNQPEGWEAPGGWPDGKPPERAAATPSAADLHPRDGAAILFVAGDVVAARLEDACRATTSLAACHASIVATGARPSGDVASLVAAVRKAFDGVVDTQTLDEIRLRMRAQIAEVLAAPILEAFRSHVARRGAAVTRLAALAVHLEVEKVIARTRACPTAAELASPTYTRVAGGLGDSVTTMREDRIISVVPPGWARRDTVAYTISCP